MTPEQRAAYSRGAHQIWRRRRLMNTAAKILGRAVTVADTERLFGVTNLLGISPRARQARRAKGSPIYQNADGTWTKRI